jgi:tripartite motif-containing protein 37
MIKGINDSSKYECRIEMVNLMDANIVVAREFASDFESGESWGYNRFFKNELLEEEGYLMPEEDTLLFKFYIRAPTYY